MTDGLPDYTAVEPPADTDPEEYTTHERRADLLRQIREAGSPRAIHQQREADRYDVHKSTISRDMDRLRESIDDHLADDAKLTTKVLFDRVPDDLLAADDWREKKAAFNMVIEWNEWLADIGEQHREADKIEAEVHGTQSGVQYQVVSDAREVDVPTTENGTPDFEALGFAEGPGGIDGDDREADR